MVRCKDKKNLYILLCGIKSRDYFYGLDFICGLSEKEKKTTNFWKNLSFYKGKRELWRRIGETTANSENKKEHWKECILFPV